MLKKILLACLIYTVLIVPNLLSLGLVEFVPGIINVCFSSDMIGNTRGEFEILIEDGVIITPYRWLNDLN